MDFGSRLKYAFTNALTDEQAKQITEDAIGTNPTLEELNHFFGKEFAVSGNKLTSATYYACMQIRCNAIAKLPLKLMRWTEKGAEKATEHELYRLFQSRPNPFMNMHDFLWATEFQRLHYGNAFWMQEVERGKVKALYLLDSFRVQIMIDNVGILNKLNSVYYVYNDPKNGMQIYENNEIVHFKNFSLNGIEGKSISQYLYEVIANEQYSSKILNEKYKTGLQDPLIVKYIGDLNEAKQTKIKKKFADLGGVSNAGKVVPIPTEFDVKQLETKLVNSQFFQLQGLTTKHIANGFGVKGFQLNDMEKSTYHNIEQQNKAFYSDTLQNVLTTYEQEMDYKLLAIFEQEKGFYSKFNVDSILRSDLVARTNAYSQGVQTGFMTIAEVRAKEDLPYIPGTDKLILGNGASIPLEDIGKQYNKGGKEK